MFTQWETQWQKSQKMHEGMQQTKTYETKIKEKELGNVVG